MPTAYDTWLEGDCGIDADAEYDEAMDEFISDRADALTDARLKDDERVKEALGDLFISAAEDQLECALARFYRAFDDAQTDASMAEAAAAMFRSLQPTVEGHIRADARSDASNEWDAMERRAAA